jgi:DNA-binding SARP family transcriptional activator
MVSLRLFGTGHLAGPAGILTGRVAQPRQLAFLALVATPPGGMTRDRIGTYLWPESTQSETRHLVADILYVLRKSLGEDGFATPGECICLNPGRMDCDVTEFRAAYTAGDWKRMLDIYEGPFLDGFHGAGGAELQLWIEDERMRCKEVALLAVARLVEACEARGDVAGAIEWLRRGRSVAPFDEVITRRLMRLSARRGNWAEAVMAYNALQHRLLHDLDLMPSPETQALLEELRAHARGGEERR